MSATRSDSTVSKTVPDQACQSTTQLAFENNQLWRRAIDWVLEWMPVILLLIAGVIDLNLLRVRHCVRDIAGATSTVAPKEVVDIGRLVLLRGSLNRSGSCVGLTPATNVRTDAL